jgi:hypothetical protein
LDINSSDKKKCVYCGEEIPAEAGRCPYCGSLLEIKVDESELTIMPVEETEQQPVTKESEIMHVDKQVEVTPANINNYKKPLSNGMKVFLSILFTVIPGIGQLAGIITAIVFMNTEDDADRKSFGVALLIASIIMFVLSCISCFIIFLVYGLSINQAFQ